jgi:hypothetical protein
VEPLRGYCPQNPILSALYPQLNLSPEKKILGTPLILIFPPIEKRDLQKIKRERRLGWDGCIDTSIMIYVCYFSHIP